MRRKKNRKACHFAFPSNRNNHLSGTSNIPLEIVTLEDNSYHIIAKVEIDGIQGEMIIDTGASVTVVDRSLFPDKGQECPVKMQSGSVTGQINDIHLVKASRFRIGGRSIKNMPLACIDLGYVNTMYDKHLSRKIIGLLGSDFCVRHKAVINYRTKELSIR